MSTDPTPSVLLIGFQDQDNLGLRYLLSSVRQAGFAGRIETYTSDPGPIVALTERLRPDVIGFSLIFQYMSPAFARVIDALRAAGCRAHITIGGHYPSFDAEEVLSRIPGADSVVRFEGERTLVELMQKLSRGEDWRGVAGIAHSQGGAVVLNPLRPVLDDLDLLPLPDRSDIDYRSQELPMASVLGSRGCPWDCSFCSIRPFYEAQGGKLRRLRSPGAVVEEMRQLHFEQGAEMFLFQDDDFMATGRRARRWAEDIAGGIIAAGLKDRIAFKISCRSDEVHYDTMARLAEAGLTHVYMGVENGDDQGLANMNKRMKASVHIEAAEILRSLDMSFDFGFMLLEPYSTIEIVRNNIAFLDRYVGDGWTVAGFCRTLPYAGTPLKTQLETEGRMLGTPFEPDYNFLDARLDRFYDWMLLTFYERNFTNSGLNEVLRRINFDARLKLPNRRKFGPSERATVQRITAECN
ncbi:MAG: B12-binding domain-containing radical SAM protein, partial [Hyphomicrobiales bacterium]|nr:B12-binding domain-containing radical SAM protein [Hyphomicrobiales bacterium]